VHVGWREVAKGGHPLEIPEGRWKYETTRVVERNCAFSQQRKRREEEEEGRWQPEADGGKVKVEVPAAEGGP